MEIKKPLSREESIKKYEKEIFSCLTDTLSIAQNYHFLVAKIIKYSSKLLDVDFLGKTFEDLPEDIQAEYKFSDQLVKFSKTYLNQPENHDEVLEKLLNLFVSATHEFTHAFDYTDNAFSEKDRQFLLGAEGLYEFANLFDGQTKQNFTDYANAVYWLARSEKVARQGSFTLLERFIKKYEFFIQETIPHTKNAEEQCKKYYDFMEQKQYLQGKTLPKLSPGNQEYYKGYSVMRKMKAFYEAEMEMECKKTLKAHQDYDLHHKNYGKALLELSENLLQNQTFGFQTEEDFIRLVWTQIVPQTYCAETLKNFSQYAEKFGLKNTTEVCALADTLAQKREKENPKRKIKEKQK